MLMQSSKILSVNLTFRVTAGLGMVLIKPLHQNELNLSSVLEVMMF